MDKSILLWTNEDLSSNPWPHASKLSAEEERQTNSGSCQAAEPKEWASE